MVEERSIRQRFGISWGTLIDPSELYFRVIEGPQTTLNGLTFEGDLGDWAGENGGGCIESCGSAIWAF